MTAEPELSRPRQAAEPVLEVEGLSIEARGENGWFDLTQDVGLTLRAGETLGLVGESGSGKTITGLSMLGVLPPNVRVRAGRIIFDGTDILSLSPRELRSVRGGHIGMVFQEPRRSLDPSFTVGEQVAETIRAHQDVSRRQARVQAIEMLDRVQIPDPAARAKQYPHQFSGGMCQRVMLAIALACRPRVLIADEPTTALDVTVQAAMLRLIKDLQNDLNLAVLLITHDMGVIAEVCDSVAVMYAGQIAEVAPVRSIFHAPAHPYTAAIRDATPDVRGDGEPMRAIPGQVPTPADWPSGCRFHPRCPHSIDECRTVTPRMDDVRQSQVRCVRASVLELTGGHDATR